MSMQGKSDPPPPSSVAAKAAAKWTAVWIIALAVFALVPRVWSAYDYATYQCIQKSAIFLLLFLAVMGVLTAWKYKVGGTRPDPWYTNGFLVALVVFWAACPPIWFLLEYYMLDSSLIKLPDAPYCDNHKRFSDCPSGKPADLKELLAYAKTYSDIAVRVWSGVSAALAGAIALAKK
jgi:hypothetical protein